MYINIIASMQFTRNVKFSIRTVKITYHQKQFNALVVYLPSTQMNSLFEFLTFQPCVIETHIQILSCQSLRFKKDKLCKLHPYLQNICKSRVRLPIILTVKNTLFLFFFFYFKYIITSGRYIVLKITLFAKRYHHHHTNRCRFS